MHRPWACFTVPESSECHIYCRHDVCKIEFECVCLLCVCLSRILWVHLWFFNLILGATLDFSFFLLFLEVTEDLSCEDRTLGPFLYISSVLWVTLGSPRPTIFSLRSESYVSAWPGNLRDGHRNCRATAVSQQKGKKGMTRKFQLTSEAKRDR